MASRLTNERFPRTNAYHPDWVAAGVGGGAHPLWLTEWLSSTLDLRPGMRVLDLGCGLAMSSIFLHREFGVQVWATDLWFSPSENYQRIRDAGFQEHVYPIHADARALPFAKDFFDVIVSIDAFPYFGTDDHYLNNLARFVKPGGLIATAGAGLMQELDTEVPDHLQEWWDPSLWCLHSPPWWRRHWERTGTVDVEVADALPDGWQLWLQWQREIAPDNLTELKAVEVDRGRYVGYIRTVGRRRPNVALEDPITSLPSEYQKSPLFRESR